MCDPKQSRPRGEPKIRLKQVQDNNRNTKYRGTEERDHKWKFRKEWLKVKTL